MSDALTGGGLVSWQSPISKQSSCESAQGSGSCSNRQHCIERNYKKLVDRGSPSAPIGTPAAADSVIRPKGLLTLLQEVFFDADSQGAGMTSIQSVTNSSSPTGSNWKAFV